MNVTNQSTRPLQLPGTTVLLEPGQARPVPDRLWERTQQHKITALWLRSGALSCDVGVSQAQPAPVAPPAPKNAPKSAPEADSGAPASEVEALLGELADFNIFRDKDTPVAELRRLLDAALQGS